ncbi:MAG: response regulator transcription factor [Bacteroidales bacterium]|nr:response regulator transcription factor [Bacteroidales bacterium]
MKLMIVDDNQRFLDSMVFLLSSSKKYKRIMTAQDGEQALEVYSKERPDLVLMDIEMPGMSGLETIRKMLWINPSVKFIAITMYQDKAYLTELISAGFNGCIFKSEVSSKLEPAIRKVMEGRYFFPEGIQLKDNRNPESI